MWIWSCESTFNYTCRVVKTERHKVLLSSSKWQQQVKLKVLIQMWGEFWPSAYCLTTSLYLANHCKTSVDGTSLLFAYNSFSYCIHRVSCLHLHLLVCVSVKVGETLSIRDGSKDRFDLIFKKERKGNTSAQQNGFRLNEGIFRLSRGRKITGGND